MDFLSYSSYPDSTNSSPRSREVDDTHSFDELPPSNFNNNNNNSNYNVKLMCSYGGKIQPRPHDNQLAYVGGDTKILAVDRNIKFSLFINKLASLCNIDTTTADPQHHPPSICFKYQLPGEDLDALVSVTNDEDLDHMMLEYDRLYRASAKPARMRLFLFQFNPTNSFGSDDVKSGRQWFVDALNSVPVQNLEASRPPQRLAGVSAGNVDFLFGSEKVFPTVPEIVVAEENQQLPYEQVFNSKLEDLNSRAYDGEYYHQQKVGEKIATPPPLPLPQAAQVAMPVLMQVPVSYAIPGNEQTVYQVPYHQTPILRPVTGQVCQGYYGMQQQQPMYNVVPPPTAAAASIPQQQKLGVYNEGIGMVQPKIEQGYLKVGYDSAGRQVYYTTTTQQYQAMTASAAPFTMPVVGLDNRQGGGGAINQDGNFQVVGGGSNVMAPQTTSL